ncbi:MAG TPA: phage holin family protein [Nocardioidaceae bacterium]|nr:phage holin family protein [Nocardioidaceae bacterium]
MKFLVWIAVNAIAIALATWLLRGITLSGASDSERAVTLVVVALIFGLINAVVRPVVKLLSFPFIILTLGLLVFVINACMLLLTSWVAGQLGVGFTVHGFLTAVYGAVIVMVATWVLELVLPDSV